MKPTRHIAKALRSELADVRDDLQRAEAMNARYSAYVANVDAAIEGLMREVLAEVIDPYAHPNSIACGRLIAAVAKASAKLHGPV